MRLNTKRLPGSWARGGTRFRLMFHNDENGARPIGEKYTSGVEPTRDFLENKIGLTPDEATRHIAEAESSVSGLRRSPYRMSEPFAAAAFDVTTMTFMP